MSNIDVEQKRYYVSQAYPGISWKERVINMRPAQVIAIYKNLQASGKLNAIKKSERAKSEKNFHQITLAEYGLK